MSREDIYKIYADADREQLLERVVDLTMKLYGTCDVISYLHRRYIDRYIDFEDVQVYLNNKSKELNMCLG